MSNFDISTAFVRVLPDLTAFRAALQKQVTAAVAGVVVPPIQGTAGVAGTKAAAAASAALSDAAVAAAAGMETLSVAQTKVTEASVREAGAALTLSRALETQRVAELKLAAAKTADKDASVIQALQVKATQAAEASVIAQQKLDLAAQKSARSLAAAAAAEGEIAAGAASATVATTELGAAAVTAAAGMESLTVAQTGMTDASLREAAAAAALTSVLETQAVAEAKLAEAKLAGADASVITGLQAKAAVAADAVVIAQERLAVAAQRSAAALGTASVAEGEIAASAAAAAAATTELGAASIEAAAGMEALSVAETGATEASVRELAASVTLTRALETQRLAELKLAAAKTAGAEASVIQALQTQAAIASDAVVVAQQRLGFASERSAQALAAAAVAEAEIAAAAVAAAAATTDLGATSVGAAAGMQGLAAATTEATGASAAEASAALAVAGALERQRLAEEKLTAAILANADASTVAALQNKAQIAASATNVAQLRQAEVLSSGLTNVGASGQKAAKGLASASTQASIAQGSLIGLTRVTGISALGLTAYSAAAVAGGLALKSAITSAANFQQQLQTFGAVTGTTGDELESVSDAARDLGADLSLPAISANDALLALTELAKAGLSVKDSLAGAKGVLQLSSAAAIDVGTAAQIAATQLNAFKLAGDQTTRVAELLADASISAQGEITDFAAGFQQVGTVANQVGLSIEDTTALLTELGKAGIRGADGGTSLRTMLLRLVPTTKEAAAFTEALGIRLDKNKSIGDQIVPVIEQYRTELAKLTPIMQQQVLTQILGQDAIRAGAVVFFQQEGALRKLTEQFERSNAIQDLAKAKTEGLKGSFGGLTSNLETAGTNLGLLASGPLQAVIDEVSEGAGLVNTFAESLLKLGKLEIPPIKIPLIFDIEFPGGSVFDAASFFRDTFGPGGPKKLAKFIADEAVDTANAVGDALNKAFPGSFLKIPTRNEREGAGGSGSTPPPSFTHLTGLTDAEKKRRAAVLALIEKQNEDADAKAKEGIPIPRPLEQSLVDAQIKGSLQAELKADNAIVNFIKQRRDKLKEGTVLFLAVSKQLEAAQSVRDSVQNEIDSNANAAAADQKQAADKAASDATERANVTLGEARAAAAAAGNQGKAEEVLIALLRKRVHDAKAHTQELLDAKKALDDELENQRRALVERTKLQIDLQNSILQTKLLKAQSTPDIEDDKAILNRQIAAAVRDRNAQQKIADDEKLGAKIRLEAALQVQADERTILTLKGQIKALQGGAGGFTLQQLFQEAADEFNAFGSNIAPRGGILSGQDARGALAQSILEIRDKTMDRTLTIQDLQLTQQELQTDYLALIAAAVTGGATTVPAPITGNRGRIGSLTAIDVSQAAAVFGVTP